ncbi:MAG TPA: MFS transporter [Streptosporangiaceae bacterium]|jgi:putative MFS transporter
MIVFRQRSAFWIGIVAVHVGVVLHLLTYARAGDKDYVLAGTPLGVATKTGIALIAIGLLLAVYGIGPHRGEAQFGAVAHVRIRAFAEGPLSNSQTTLIGVMVAATLVTTTTLATLAFVVPGMTDEYQLASALVIWLPLGALAGMVVGFLTWGRLGERIGRRAAILLAGVIFIATAVGGSLPAFGWNLLMGFLMGVALGGLIPIGVTLVAETIPAQHRRRLLACVGAGVAGAFVVTGALAAGLEPGFGWRVMGLIGLPAGFLLILLNRWIPESPRFLLATGRVNEAAEVMTRYGAAVMYQDRRSRRS